MLLAAMRAAGDYTSPQAKLLAAACWEAQFGGTFATLLDNACAQADHAAPGAHMDELLAAIQRLRQKGNRYADWDAIEQWY